MSSTLRVESQADFRKFGPAVFRRIVPDSVVEEIASRHGGDLRKRKLPVVVHLWLLVMVQLDGLARCLDAVIERSWEGLRDELGLPPGSKPLDKSSLSRKNSSRSPAIFRDVFLWLIREYQERFSTPLCFPMLEMKTAILDSTSVDIAARLYRWFFNGGKHRKAGHAQAKVHVLYDADLKLPSEAEISRGSAHDMKWAKRLLRKLLEPTLVLFDRGYWDHALFTWLVHQGHGFVTRLKDNVCPRKIKRLGKGDWLVRFDASKGKEIPFPLRMIKWKAENGDTLFFITSLTDAEAFPPELIAEMYVKRWEIEIFFRDLKHVLRMENFLSYSANGIRLQIYAALIAYVLLKYIRAEASEATKTNLTELSFKRTVDIVAIWLGASPRRCYGASERQTKTQWSDLLTSIGTYAYQRQRTRASQSGKRSSKRAA
ncbi:IS4 family transposase [Planctomycetota bacterium]